MEKISISRAQLDDIPAVAPLFAAYRQFYLQPFELEVAEDFLLARLENNESVILQAKSSSGKALGFCQIYPSFCSILAAPIFILSDLFVAEDYRQQGIGEGLLEAAHQYALSKGFVRMELTTAKTNLVAQSLYESLGWTRDNVYYAYNKAVANADH
ncbi:MAG TPA: GNAT family N-acetyltransferase [Cellvibrio sp.]|nr:GNAT family N-acetyltransferase [Cellvibrio sp.]